MPTIYVKKDLLMHSLGTNYTDTEFDALCFEYGIELDEITSEKKIAMRERAIGDGESLSEDVMYKIDIPANRYDLLSLESLVLALRIFTGKMKPPNYRVKTSGIEFTVDEHASAIRPVLLAAVVRGVTFTQDFYKSFIDLQDKIHTNIGRKRTIVSIGTHDLDKIDGPFLYTAVEPSILKFKPLNQTNEYTGLGLMNLYADSHLKQYLPIIKDKPEYPVIFDYRKNVLSMPPIINGDMSKITLNTKNVLIEITATDREKATIALDTIVTMLTSVNGTFEAESVSIRHTVDNKIYTTPDLSYHEETISGTCINRGLGIDISPAEIASLLTRMSLKAEVLNGDTLKVLIPPTRHDIINSCDVMEDVGIAYGYDNICKTLPKSSTIASQVPLNKLADQLRQEVSRCGFTEGLNFALCSDKEMQSVIKCPVVAGDTAVRIENPKTMEFEVARTSLLPGLLKTINSNKKLPLPLKLFEVGDVVIRDWSCDVGARNRRHLCAVYMGKQTSGFELLHGLLDRVMQVLEAPYKDDHNTESAPDCTDGYHIERLAANMDGVFLPGRGASVIYRGVKIGHLGTLHPQILADYELGHPTSALEIQLESFDFAKSK